MSVNPTIIIPGIGQSKVIAVDSNGNKIKSVWPLEIDTKSILNDIKGRLVKMMLFKKDGGFSDKVAEIVGDILDPCSCSADGVSKYDCRPVSYPSVAKCTPDEKRYIYKMVPMEQLGQEIGEDKLYFFSFSPFGNVYSVARDLDKFVEQVKSEHGADKVNFISVSLGGCVLRAYLDLFADKGDVEKTVNVVSCLQGTSLATDIYNGNLNLDDPVALLQSIGGKAADMAGMIKMLPSDVISNTIKKCYKVVMDKLGRGSTMLWSTITPDKFEQTVESVSEKYGTIGVLDEITRFNEYSLNFPETAKKLADGGMEFYQIAGYNKKMFEVLGSSNTSTDTIIDASSTTLGATAAKPDEKLDCGTRLSPDGNVDFGTCTFPERTWGFYDQCHDDVAYNDIVLGLVREIITGRVTNVNSSEKYPQFNGSRNIRKLKYNLVPKANELIKANDAKKAELEKLVSAYEEMLENTICTDNKQAKALTDSFKAVLDR